MRIDSGSLSVNRVHLLQALRQINHLTGVGKQPAVLTYANGALQIALGGCAFRADAEGEWAGQVTVPASFIRRLAKAPPGGNGPVPISTDGETLRIGFVATECRWDRLVHPRIELPLGATLLHKLMLRLSYSGDDISSSNLMDEVKAAEAERDKLIEKAARLLQPLGIKESDMRELVDSVLRQRLSERSVV